MKNKFAFSVFIACFLLGISPKFVFSADTLRTFQYTQRSYNEAIIWQNELRYSLFQLLKLNDLLSEKKTIQFNPVEVLSVEKGKFILKEIEINTTPERRIKIVITFPEKMRKPAPAVVCIHGHGGELYSVYDGNSIYKGFADTLASGGYITIACVVSQHEVDEKDRMLMGERLWDLMRCVDYLESLKEVDKTRLGCAGLSLGGEMAMWLGGMDIRIKATVSSGFLTKMDQMEKNHCMCWKFPGLRNLVDFVDIYSLISPRALSCQNGLQEPTTQFYVPLAREAFSEIELIYRDLNANENLKLDIHNGGHEIYLKGLVEFFEKQLIKK
jgi:hypothetical protein